MRSVPPKGLLINRLTIAVFIPLPLSSTFFIENDSEMIEYYPVLTIAGSDCSGGAGIQADLKTIQAEGCYGMSAITALTAQNTRGVYGVEAVSPGFVVAQIEACVSDIVPLAVKTGMLFNAAIVDVVADAIGRLELQPVVVDPVMVSTSGCRLLDDDAVEAVMKRLLPLATVVTPNVHEAIVMTGKTDPREQARVLRDRGARNVLLKGGDADNSYGLKIDYLLTEDDNELIELKADAVDTVNTHGTGCSLSAAIAARLALGDDTVTAVSRAKLYVTRALQAGARVHVGGGHGPMNHSFDPKRMKTRKTPWK